MNPLEDKARKLIDHLQTVQSEAESVDAKNEAVSEKLSAQEIRVLHAVGGDHHCIMGRIAARIRLSLSSCTGLIDRLCEKKLVKRDRSSEDRRVVQVELTDEGRTLHEAAMEGRLAFAKDLLKNLSAEDQESLVNLLGKVSERLKEKKPA